MFFSSPLVTGITGQDQPEDYEGECDTNQDLTTAEKKTEVYADLHADDSVDSSYSIIHSDFFSSLLSSLWCKHCQSDTLQLQKSCSRGLASQYRIYCPACDSNIWSGWTSPYVNRHFDINTRAVLACKENGVGYSKFTSLLSTMSIKEQMHVKTFQNISTEIHYASTESAEDAMNIAASFVKERVASECSQSKDTTSKSECPVITVSYDGTWQKRGHSSHNGVGVAIEVDSGLVLDFQVVSNYCKVCQNGVKPNSPTYDTWQLQHKWKCQKNFDGSSNAMEAEAAKHIFARSVRKRQLVYGRMLCDGDSKAFVEANKSSGYDIQIVKEDCINHIAKRMFNSLEKVKSENKALLNRKLTQPKIVKITNIYAANLKYNAPNVDKMKNGVLGGFFHMLSTDSAPNHKFCPDGEKSWCHYKRSMAKNAPYEKHRPTFTPEVGAVIYPTVVRLTDPELLQRCSKMGTQNANESFNSLIWQRCPKQNFSSRMSVETATSLAVLAFNCGPVGLKMVIKKLGLLWTSINADNALKKHTKKLADSRKRKMGVSKWKRKNQKKRRIHLEHERTEEEGDTYMAGGFNF